MEIASLPVEFNKDEFNSRFRLIIVAVQRTRQLMLEGSKPVIVSKYTKETMVALEEVLESRIHHLKGKEAKVALREAAQARLAHIGVEEEEKDELAKEIRRELSVYMAEQEQKKRGTGKEEDAGS